MTDTLKTEVDRIRILANHLNVDENVKKALSQVDQV